MKAGFYQGDIALNKISENIDKFYNTIKDYNFDLIVLPELFTTGYKLKVEEVKKYSEPIELEDYLDSDRMKEIETGFASSKGELPWPVDSRTIAEHFGTKRHPVFGTKTSNLGIEIVADSASTVRAVHPGQVINVMPVPSYGDVVFVKHGHFITAYGNLSQIQVRNREIIRQGDVIGLSGTSTSPKGETLFFLIRKNNETLDPEEWLQLETVSSKY